MRYTLQKKNRKLKSSNPKMIPNQLEPTYLKSSNPLKNIFALSKTDTTDQIPFPGPRKAPKRSTTATRTRGQDRNPAGGQHRNPAGSARGSPRSAQLARRAAARPATGSLSPSRPDGGARRLYSRRESRFRRDGVSFSPRRDGGFARRTVFSRP